MNTEAFEPEPEIKVLRAKRRDRLKEDWISNHDKVDENGDKIEEVPYRKSDNTFDVNLSSMFGPSVSLTGDVGLLVLEAEMVKEGKELENPHIPITKEVKEAAVSQLKDDGLNPAWEQ